MIKQILLKDYILINELLVEFDNGLNVITGETGAGKSIVINAIDLVFAQRISKEVIKSGCEKATIELILTYQGNALNEMFEQNGIDNFGDEIIISKEISSNAVRSRVNGTLVNQEFISTLKDKFLDIHSQNQTYAYLQPKSHINLLDSYAKDLYGFLLDEYKNLYTDYIRLQQLLDSAKQGANSTENHIDFLKFQIKEIEEAQVVDPQEDENLRHELSVLENVEKLKELTGSSNWALSGDDNSIITVLGVIKSNVSKASQLDEKLGSIEGDLIGAVEILQEVSSGLRNYSDNLENDTERLNWVQERLFLLDKIKRKYGTSLHEVMETHQRLCEELSQIEHSTQNIEELEAQINNILGELNIKADVISAKRKECAQSLSFLIVEKLERLELPRVQFEISVEQFGVGELNKYGKDKVEFLISTNVSEDLKPLAKVASGGEISRVMLAIKTIFAQNDEIDTVIFDEIDTGISGKTSQSVADEIAELSRFHQIILITHQPIIASKAQKHFYVKKAQGEQSTEIGFYVLEGENKINAIAELAGGEINEQSLDFAKSLLGG